MADDNDFPPIPAAADASEDSVRVHVCVCVGREIVCIIIEPAQDLQAFRDLDNSDVRDMDLGGGGGGGGGDGGDDAALPVSDANADQADRQERRNSVVTDFLQQNNHASAEVCVFREYYITRFYRDKMQETMEPAYLLPLPPCDHQLETPSPASEARRCVTCFICFPVFPFFLFFFLPCLSSLPPLSLFLSFSLSLSLSLSLSHFSFFLLIFDILSSVSYARGIGFCESCP
jgi:hypothetical protein